MNPGRELDALVAEKVMGCSVRNGHCCCEPNRPHGRSDYRAEQQRVYCPLKPYSTSIEAAWEVVEKIKNIRGTDGTFKIQYWHPGSVVYADHEDLLGCDFDHTIYSWGQTAPHAICLAALKAVGVEI